MAVTGTRTPSRRRSEPEGIFVPTNFWTRLKVMVRQESSRLAQCYRALLHCIVSSMAEYDLDKLIAQCKATGEHITNAILCFSV